MTDSMRLNTVSDDINLIPTRIHEVTLADVLKSNYS